MVLTLILNISIIILILTTFTTLAISAEIKRNRSNNKLGITKITTEERENSFIHKFINNELNFLNESDDAKANKIELDEIRDEVEKLKAQKINNIDTANNNERAVKACSPPDNKVKFCNFFPGGLAYTSSPACLK